MKSKKVVIHNETGLHARPAKEFVNLAKQFKADIKLEFGSKVAKGKSLLSLLTLGVVSGSEITIITDGEDEQEALTILEQAVKDGLGEGAEDKKYLKSEKKHIPQELNFQKKVDVTENTLVGIGVAKGVVIGKPFIFKRKELQKIKEIKSNEEEISLLRSSIQEVAIQLETLRETLSTSGAKDEMAIFDVHIELLEDVELLDTVEERIKTYNENAAQAWQKVVDSRADVISSLQDELLSARAADIHDVGYRVLRGIVGENNDEIEIPDYPVIICANDLTPSDTVSLKGKNILGFCTAVGGPTSHTAIIARALGMPAVVSIGEKILSVDTTIILDGYNGHVIVEPTEEQIQKIKEFEQKQVEIRKEEEKHANVPAITIDGHKVTIAANIGNVEEAKKAKDRGAEGIGLLRTEFLFLERKDPPQDGEQFAVYKEIAEIMDQNAVVIRTLDVGGDKPLPYVPMPEEENPFLGIRGIRLALARPELLKQQLEEIFKAAAYGKLHIMFPMVANYNEWLEIKNVINTIEIPENVDYELGIMVEIPSTAILADVFAKEVDFFSIGTNDLTQYTLAIDRMHPKLAKKSDGLNPAILRLIEMTVKAAHNEGKWVGVCGELGADLIALPILIGLGVDEISVNIQSIAEVKAAVRKIDYKKAKYLAKKTLSLQTAEQVRNYVKNEKVQ